MKRKKIHNLDSLEAEIYRLKSDARNIEDTLDKNLDYLQDNYWTMTMNSLFCKDDHKKNGESSFWKSFFRHETVNTTINTIAGNIADKASEGLYNWMNNFFGNKRH